MKDFNNNFNNMTKQEQQEQKLKDIKRIMKYEMDKIINKGVNNG